MTLDLDELEARITEGEKKNFFVAPVVKQLIAELREARGERPAVVAYLRGFDADTLSASSDLRWCIRGLANCIERGEHRP